MPKIIKYSQEELSWIKDNCTLTRKELHNKFCDKFNRQDISIDNIKSLCTRKGWKSGRTGQFQKGNIPVNKGKPLEAFCSPETIKKISKTWFKKGNLPHNANFEGHERITKDGYIEISIAETNPRTGFERRYVLKHRLLWEKENGKLPEGMCLKCLDGNRQNTNPSNWEAIDKRANLFLNNPKSSKLNYDEAPEELKPVILNIAKLKSKRSQIKAKGKS
jgi:hypothetical protein